MQRCRIFHRLHSKHTYRVLTIFLLLLISLNLVPLPAPVTISTTSKAWWNSSWQYHRVCNIDTNGYSGYYQMKINVSYSSGGDVSCNGHCQSDFDDIRFVDIDNSTVLPHWKEKYVDSQYAIFWVNVSADAMSDGKILMYYGNPSATTTSDGNETFIYYNDGTKTSGWVTCKGSPSISTDGNYLDVHCTTDETVAIYDSDVLISEGVLLKTRFKQYGANVNGHHVGFQRPSGDDCEYNSLFAYDSDKYNYWRFRSEKDGSASYNAISGSPDFYNFHVYETAWYNDGGTHTGKFWYDGTLKSTKTNNIPTTDMYIGIQVTPPTSNGLKIDYIIVRKYADPEPEWSGFGSEQSQGNAPPVVFNPSPSDGATDVPLTLTELNVTIEDPDGDTFDWTIETSPNIGSSSGTDDTNGTKTCSVSGLQAHTTYTWYVNVTDGEYWTNKTYTFTTLNNPPTISNPSPANGSTGISLQPTCSIYVSDDDDDKEVDDAAQFNSRFSHTPRYGKKSRKPGIQSSVNTQSFQY